MHRPVVALLIAALAPLPIAAQPPDDADGQALALQKVLHKVIAQVEPSVACILVSRSDDYRRLGLGPDKEHPGQLGDFDPEVLRSKPGLRSHKDRLALAAQARPRRPGPCAAGVRQRRRHRPGRPRCSPTITSCRTPPRSMCGCPAARGAMPTSTPPTRAATWPCCSCSVRKCRPRADRAWAMPASSSAGSFVLIDRQLVRRRLPRRPAERVAGASSATSAAAAVAAPRDEDQAKPLHYYGTLLQTDARLHLGCSGGALRQPRRRDDRPDHGAGGHPGRRDARRLRHPGQRRPAPHHRRAQTRRGSRIRLPRRRLRGTRPRRRRRRHAGVRHHRLARLRRGQAPRQGCHPVHQRHAAQAIRRPAHHARHAARRQQDSTCAIAAARSVRTADVTLAKLYVPGKKIASSLANRPFYRGLRVDYTSVLAQKPPRLPSIPRGGAGHATCSRTRRPSGPSSSRATSSRTSTACRSTRRPRSTPRWTAPRSRWS